MLAAGTRGPSNGHVGLFGPGAAGAEETRPAAEMGGPRDGARRGTQNSRPVIEP
ncbi:hypothetical protein [Corynebacterium xerosis]|uniref:hypothetical protein n=1 Tax=Corynebacterium xerosis TaxID=1725 RepID=UPI0015E0B1B5|nr:hypothetical protein [Corynebacterium xerosis]